MFDIKMTLNLETFWHQYYFITIEVDV